MHRMGSESQHKIYHVLLYVNHQRTSFEIMYEVYQQFLTLGDHAKIFSLEPFGQEFDSVVPMEANQKNLNLIDLIIVVGDNETLMKLIRFYNLKNTPPILGIGNGCSPGIYNYLKFQTREAVTAVIQNLRNNSLHSQKLMKLNCNNNCETVTQAVCQLEIHRDMKEPIIILNLYLENESRTKFKIGTFKGDGLLISTPLGSYCKSLSLNGPLMSKTMQNIMITAICPLSMKFRPLCLPANSKIFIEIDPICRTDYALLYFDEGGFSGRLNKGDLLRIRTSKYKANLIANLLEGSQELFIKGLRNTIRWGENSELLEIEEILLKKKTSQI